VKEKAGAARREARIANPELFSKVQSEAPVGKESRS
jgi:hypothetical protein